MLLLVYSFNVPVTKKVTFTRKLKDAKLWNLRSNWLMIMIMVAWLPKQGQNFYFPKKIILFYSVPPVGVNPSRDGDTKPRVSKRDSRVTKGGKKMLKRSVILFLVMAMLVSFSAAVLADDSKDLEEGKAPKNKAGVRILVDDNDDGVKEIHFLDAVPDHAEESGNSDRPTNPIAVAGK